ncbi:glycoprotein integral membrane protein 1 [Lethenteron reissneri]|uniref:glycoprotein integral membrane protein 1 n=1 Tax=Lethenteron reissneri TaxID=7753 RepID=UPI002AB6130E|nr:glycoprotein integral membrane protein 1 [Lethenteron reissneri]
MAKAGAVILFAVFANAAFVGVSAESNAQINVLVQSLNQSRQFEVRLDVTVSEGKVSVNTHPVGSNVVTRVDCQADVAELATDGVSVLQQWSSPVSLRVLVLESPISGQPGRPGIVAQLQVTDIDSTQVTQALVPMLEVTFGMSQNEVRRATWSVPMEESMLYSMPRDADTYGTLPNTPGKELPAGPLQTTSHYPMGQAETTLEEAAAPGKLPETPLRAEPPSSYKLVCQRAEMLRQEVCRLWRSLWQQALPLVCGAALLVVVGALGGTVIVLGLRVLCPHAHDSKFDSKAFYVDNLQMDFQPLIVDKKGTPC